MDISSLFDNYEQAGFLDTFESPFDYMRRFNGQRFTVLGIRQKVRNKE